MELWVRESGMCPDAELPRMLKGLLREDTAVLAFYTDGFAAARGELPEAEDFSRLLELRAFGEDWELWAHRSSLGADFAWRVADDALLRDRAALVPEPWLRDPACHCYESFQVLDIDETYGRKPDGRGCARLRTTGGGYYSLPIGEKERLVSVINYVRYDGDGAAYAADFRLAGFRN